MSHPQEAPRSAFLSRLNRCLIFGVIGLAVAHFLVVNDLSTKGFVFKDLKQQTKHLNADRQSMESRVTALSSYQTLNPRIQALALVTTDNVHYLSWNQQMVAKR